MQRSQALVLAVMGAVMAVLVAAHLVATHGTGRLDDEEKERVAISPAAALALSPQLAWAGLFHFSWRHLGYNLAVFAFAFPFAARGGIWSTLAIAVAVSLTTSLVLPVLVIRPLADLGIGYAADALDNSLVGASIGMYAIVGTALVRTSGRVAALVVAVAIVGEAIAAIVGTRPFVFAYHLTGLGLGYAARWLLDTARMASVRISPDRHSSSRLRRAFSGRKGQSTQLGSASQHASDRSLDASGGQDMDWGGASRRSQAARRSAVLLQDQAAPRGLRAGHVADAVDDRVEV